MTTRYSLVHRCFACSHHKEKPLPTFTKTIVYFDQFVISKMVKAKDPYWKEVSIRIEKLINSQVVACPYSPLHRRESMLCFDLSDALQEMYKSLGGNDRFRSPGDIQEAQLVRSLQYHLGVENSDGAEVTWEDAFEENPHLFTGDMVVTVRMPSHPFITSSVRQQKQALSESLKAVCELRRQNPASFEDDLREERDGFSRALLDVYGRAAGTRRFDPSMPPSLSPPVRLVHRLASEAQRAKPDEVDPVACVEAFLYSDKAHDTPFLDIQCKLWAKIAQNERSPGPRQPKESDSFDVDMVSHYAPYCDAMFIDNEFRGIASDNQVPTQYGVRLFSEKGQGRQLFLDYLDEVWSTVPDEHWNKVANCDPRFASLLQKARELERKSQMAPENGSKQVD